MLDLVQKWFNGNSGYKWNTNNAWTSEYCDMHIPYFLPLKNSNPEKSLSQNRLPLKNPKLKTLYPWRIPRSEPFSHDEFQAQNPLPLGGGGGGGVLKGGGGGD